jgi:SAM-dependent methyltransferase
VAREVRRVAIVGASDGKFVVPLAEMGYEVVAIERDQLAIDGGAAPGPAGALEWRIAGLRKRLAAEDLAAQVDIYVTDLFDLEVVPACDAVWTSCSWHYSVNHERPMQAYIDRMTALLRPGGLFGAEYMMPIELQHYEVEHYLDEGEIRDYLKAADVLWEVASAPFVEAPHLGQPEPHSHRMGFVLAQLPPYQPAGWATLTQARPI